ncbi:MAG TPA: diguanylate cyclase [Steroidobacteraceae bacterium]|jgi:two-component system cell cycle response regulator
MSADPGVVTDLTQDRSAAILLAEDDPVTRMLMTRFLKKAGYEVDAVADGTDALEHMTQRYYPFLVTDWEMPEMDGIELCKAVRNLQLDGYVYALLLTARNAKEHIIAGLEAGADDYLVKPVHEPELIARLNTGRRILALEHSLRAANERNRILSVTDPLTGAFNRRYMMEQLPRELERCRRYGNPLSVIMCDVDHFKQVNDVKGHSAGDDVLQQFVARMQRSIRGTSDWVARLGGEEFLIVLPETGFQGAMIVAEKIRAIMTSVPFVTREGDVVATSSFGVASTELHGPDLAMKSETLIRAADQCLYTSKQSGRNRATGVEIPTVHAQSAHG